ncbi:toxin-antitoxin system YwqK family antitoxin [Atlantibacter hermannii]|uniref:toxin-antitoxin system YwqK family antitoxin n=1 Tax=Atlantibacter hermannii TaxID=565 RepID=UPI0028B0F59A|nr:toxin-antitoxin system YwqK family antitoxin [Atlantibacter hermannii]
MQRALPILTFTLLLSGCAGFSSSVTNTIDAMGMTPDYAKGMNEDLQMRKLETASISVTDNVPEGKLVERYDNGNKKFETVVKNRCFNEYLDLYYPNGQLRTHTPLVNCKAEGKSQGYTQDGKLRTVITYKNGLANGEVVAYDANGHVAKSMIYKDGYPAEKP